MSSGIINIASKAAYAAANAIQRRSNDISKIHIKSKGHNDFVTELDKLSEQIIIETIKKAYPEHNILGEESGLDDSSGSHCTWIIDPIDGTLNFMHGHPQYSISIAFKENDKITHGIVFDPTRNDLYRAEIGRGAYLNEKRIRVTKASYLEDALFATGYPTNDPIIFEKFMAIFRDMLLCTQGQRRQGSAALDLAYVARGSLDGFWEFNLKQWDFAAGYLLVKEAGGLVCDFNGTQNFWENGNIAAGNPKILSEMLKVIKRHL